VAAREQFGEHGAADETGGTDEGDLHGETPEKVGMDLVSWLHEKRGRRQNPLSSCRKSNQ
jgi:hypothetical protein